ncbi:unnamed protein product [Malus baccata var. baccata]
MNANGQICIQQAIDKAGKEFATDLEYKCSSPLASLNYNLSFGDPPTWFLPSRVNSGHLDFTSEDGAIKVGQNQGDLFQAYILMKVNNEADGSKVSLAPTVLGYIYHGLGNIASCPRGPRSTYTSMPVHYIVGWLGEHFPYLYRSRPDNDFPKGYPPLARYAGIEPREVSISHARFIFRSEKYRKGCFVMDNEDLYDNHFELLVYVCTTKVSVKIGEHLWIEPYFTNRFTHQFGFNQGVPANKLAFRISSRQNCNVEDMFKAGGGLLVQHILGLLWPIFTLSSINILLIKRQFLLSGLRDVSPGLRKEVLLSEVGIEKSPSLRPVGSSHDVNFKRAHYEKLDDLSGVDIETVVAADTEILGCHDEVNLVFDVLRPIINLLESGRTELEWFV